MTHIQQSYFIYFQFKFIPKRILLCFRKRMDLCIIIHNVVYNLHTFTKRLYTLRLHLCMHQKFDHTEWAVSAALRWPYCRGEKFMISFKIKCVIALNVQILELTKSFELDIRLPRYINCQSQGNQQLWKQLSLYFIYFWDFAI